VSLVDSDFTKVQTMKIQNVMPTRRFVRSPQTPIVRNAIKAELPKIRVDTRLPKNTFSVDDRIHVSLPFDLAVQVGEILLERPRDNQMIVALGHHLQNLEDNFESFDKE
jgi:hypothetical protein